MTYGEAIVKEYNKWMGKYTEAWAAPVNMTEASAAGFMCGAIVDRINGSKDDELKTYFRDNAYCEHKSILFKIEKVGSKFEGHVLLPPPDALYKAGFLWVKTMLGDTWATAYDLCVDVIERM